MVKTAWKHLSVEKQRKRNLLEYLMPDYLEQHIMTSKQNAFRHLFDLVDELNWVFRAFPYDSISSVESTWASCNHFSVIACLHSNYLNFFVVLGCHLPLLPGFDWIIKLLSAVLNSAVNKSQQHQEKNSWERRDLNFGPLGENQECYLCVASPQPNLILWMSLCQETTKINLLCEEHVFQVLRDATECHNYQINYWLRQTDWPEN